MPPTDRPYSRVYWSIIDDERFESIYGSDPNLATWLRLLIAADQAWPASPQLPALANPRSVRALVAAGLVERVGRYNVYRIHGLDRERERRASAPRAAARERWAKPRDDEPPQTARSASAPPGARKPMRTQSERTPDALRAHSERIASAATPPDADAMLDETRRDRDVLLPSESARRARPATGSARRDVDEARLTREQLKAWESYADPAWQPFKAAWIARGFLWPPSGDATDDEEASERARLWHLVNPADGGRSKSVGQWVQAAPKGADAYAVIGFVFARFNELRGELLGAAEADADFGTGPSKAEATEALGSLMGRVAAHVPGPATPEVVKT